MVQHVTIVPKSHDDLTPTAEPFTVKLWRDDQTLKWGLAGIYCWPAGVSPPILFLGADPDRGYLDWPGSVPTPIGPPPPEGQPDRRYYTATSDKVLDPGTPTEKYHYKFAVCPIDNPNCPLEISLELEAPRSQQRQGKDMRWYDPDVDNEAQP